MRRKLFITGICGFAGRYLARELAARGHQLSGLLAPGEQAHPWVIESGAELRKSDLLDLPGLRETVRQLQPDMIIHMAAQSAPGKSFADPMGFFQINVQGTQHVLESAKVARTCGRVVVFSSSDVYGYVDEDELPLTEDSPLRPANPYAASKVACHLLAQQYQLNFGVETVEVRPFNMLGPEQSRGFVLPDFASQVAAIINGDQEPVISVGRLTDKRDFLDVRDAVKAMADIAELGKPGEAYNICSGTPSQVSMLLESLISGAERHIAIREDPDRLRPTRMPIHYGSSKKVRELAGWRPRIELEQTIADTLNYWISQKRQD